MRYHYTLDDVLGSELKVRILRLFCRTKASYTGREVARLVGYSHTQTLIALSELEANGLLEWQPVGKAYLFSLNDRHVLVRQVLTPAFKFEDHALREVIKAFEDVLGDDLLKTIVFGSVARGEESPDGDVDLILVLKDDAGYEAAEEKMLDIAVDLAIATGNTISPILVRQSELERKRRSRAKKGMWKDVFGGAPTVVFEA